MDILGVRASRDHWIAYPQVTHTRINIRRGMTLACKARVANKCTDHTRAGWQIGELRLAMRQLRLAQEGPVLSNYHRLRIDARLDEINDELAQLEKGTVARDKEREERRR